MSNTKLIEFPLSDEEIQKCIDKAGYSGVYTPYDVKKYFYDMVKSALEDYNE